jgi:hypothetical protein
MIPPNKGILYAKNSQEMAKMAIALASNPRDQQATSELGVELMNEHCNWNHQLVKFHMLLTSIIDRTK